MTLDWSTITSLESAPSEREPFENAERVESWDKLGERAGIKTL
jgi:hypothetical protein